MSDTDGPMFSRPAHPFREPCDQKLQTLVPASVHEDFAAVARIKGFPTSAAYLRFLVYEHLHGSLHTLRLLNGQREGAEPDR